MAKVAYELNYGVPREIEEPRKKPNLRVQKNLKKEKKRKTLHQFSMFFLAATILFLVCGVLYTQSTIAELQTDINAQNKQLAEVNTEYRNLTSQLDSKVNLKTIEDQAAALGLVKLENNQKVYIRSQNGNQIQVKNSPIVQFISSAGLEELMIMNYLEN